MSSVSPARLAAYRTVRRVAEGNAYADRALLTEARGLESRDRALAKQITFGVVQRRGTLDWVISAFAKGKVDPAVRAALWVGLYELMFLATADHAAVGQAVELAKPSPGHKLVNAVLRRVQREGVELPSDDDVAGAAVRHSHPEWLVALWWEQLGPETTRALLAADNEPADLVLRVNTLAPGHEDVVLPDGRREGDALIVDGPFDVAGSDLFASGLVTPQSRAAQLVAVRLDPQPGERVLDMCAAPGGKTTHLAALMGDNGEVMAVERSAARADALRATCARMHATCVTVVEADAAEYDGRGTFDRVLVDPPCSGLGTLRTHPDLRWRMTPAAIDGLVVIQDAILASARRAVAPGGTIVYSTCTINAREERLADAECIRTLPHRDGTDGFYIARETA